MHAPASAFLQPLQQLQQQAVLQPRASAGASLQPPSQLPLQRHQYHLQHLQHLQLLHVLPSAQQHQQQRLKRLNLQQQQLQVQEQYQL